MELEIKSMNSWDNTEINNLIKALGVICSGQKAYGKEINLKELFAYFKMKLEGRFTVTQVLYAVQVYTDRKNDIPAPADIIQILQPEPPKMTYAEYKHALEQWKANGCKTQCEYKRKIDFYENQGQEERQNFKAESDQVKSLGIDTQKLLKKF